MQSLIACAPFATALAGPFLPLLIVFAGTLPASAPHPSPALAAWLGGIIFIALLLSLIGLLGARSRYFPAPLGKALVLLVGAQCIALVWAIDPRAGVFGILTVSAGCLVLVCCAQALAPLRARRAFVACYLVSGAIAAAAACVLTTSRLPPAMFAYEHGRASGTFLQPNELAGYMLFLIPLGIAQLGAPRWLRSIGLAAAAAGGAALALSVSRAAIVSLVLAGALLARRFSVRTLAAYAAVAAAVLILFATALRNVAHDPSENASRLAVWSGAARLAQRFALTGVGPLGFHIAYPNFRMPQSSANEVHAHDVPAQILIEDGVLGLAAFGWFVTVVGWQFKRIGRSIAARDRERALLFAALMTGFAASGLQAIVDVVTTFWLVVLWPMLGLTLALERQTDVAP